MFQIYKVKPLVVLLLAFCSFTLKAQQKRLYLANDDHTDYMWSGNEAQYDSVFVKMIDYHLRKIDSTKNFPTNFQNRFNCDGSYWLNAYQKYRSIAQFNKLIAAIKSGHISSQLNSVVSTFGAQPAEAAIRGMYYAGQLERNYKLRFTMASSMENNTLPLGLSSLWAGSGAKYSWKGIGGYGSQLSYPSRANRQYPMHRYQGLDGTSVLMKWYAYNEKTTGSLGGYGECRFDMKSLDIPAELRKAVNVIRDLDKNSKYPYKIAGAFGYGHDNLQTFIADPFIEVAKAETNATQTVRVSNEEDFFMDFDKTYPKLPIRSVSYGNEWDLLCASMNETTAEVRRATEKLRSAEALSALVSLTQPNFADQLLPSRKLAWDALGLYWEHNWTGDGPVNNKVRGLWQVKLKENLKSYVDSLYDLGVKTLGNQLQKTKDDRFYVFNPLSFIRNDIADIPYKGTEPVKVIDVSTQLEVPSQSITKQGISYLRILAENIPSVGYKLFEIRKGAAKNYLPVATLKNGYIDHVNYKIKLTQSGVITEIVDKKANNKSLVKQIDGKYLNDLGVVDVNIGQPLQIENAGPVSVTFKAVSSHPLLHTVRLTLYALDTKIEIENSIDTNFKDNKTWAFSFNIDHPTTRHEEVGAVLTVKKESNGGHYADQIARYDWQTFNHFADLSNADHGVTISNVDCSFFKLGKSRMDSLDESSSQLQALAGGRIDKKVEDNGVLGIHDQLGQQNFNYHFALFPHQDKFNATRAMKLSLAHQNPLTAAFVTGLKGSQGNSFSLLNISDANVLLWSIKPAEEGIKNGIITRFWNMKPDLLQPTLSFNKPIIGAWKTSHIETNQFLIKPVNGKIKTVFNPHQINTYRLTSIPIIKTK
ncbi:glycoside hydrolase [Pedobacter frigiditerrae]|uniref:Glycoside hydrolase n=1 Tax=Pedobacter frigiditerrae TaxID=2530452 RepID=A0A4R0MR40_9SPHI|nr:glycosyl hydrolase-related protein [Pedobacter frigiditerrae]TCC88742.1 glycoside hydrolase [Pedobacter frigiditerrae]